MDLHWQLMEWREKCNRLIVCMDANKDIYEKKIGRMLTDYNGLCINEVVGTTQAKNRGYILQG